MRLRALAFNADLVLDLCKGGPPRLVEIVEHPLPADARFIRAGHDGYGMLQLMIESASFEDVPAGHVPPPQPPVVFRVVKEKSDV